MRLSENFTRDEFACPDGCGFDTVDTGLLLLLEQIRAHFDRRVYINSGCRCETRNIAVGGSRGSQHLIGRAADIVVDMTPPSIVAEFAHQIGAGGVGNYKTFTHVDSRNGWARWSE